MAAKRTGTAGETRTGEAVATTATGKGNASIPPTASPRSLPIAAAGVATGEDFANLMSALMSDLIEGTIDPVTANAACNAGGKLLKIVEMQYRHKSQPREREDVLTLATGVRR